MIVKIALEDITIDEYANYRDVRDPSVPGYKEILSDIENQGWSCLENAIVINDGITYANGRRKYQVIDGRNRVYMMKQCKALKPQFRYINAIVIDRSKNPPLSLLWICSFRRNQQSHTILKERLGDKLNFIRKIKTEISASTGTYSFSAFMKIMNMKNVNTYKVYFAAINSYPKECIDLIIKNASEEISVFKKENCLFNSSGNRNKTFKALKVKSKIHLFNWIYSSGMEKGKILTGVQVGEKLIKYKENEKICFDCTQALTSRKFGFLQDALVTSTKIQKACEKVDNKLLFLLHEESNRLPIPYSSVRSKLKAQESVQYSLIYFLCYWVCTGNKDVKLLEKGYHEQVNNLAILLTEKITEDQRRPSKSGQLNKRQKTKRAATTTDSSQDTLIRSKVLTTVSSRSKTSCLRVRLKTPKLITLLTENLTETIHETSEIGPHEAAQKHNEAAGCSEARTDSIEEQSDHSEIGPAPALFDMGDRVKVRLQHDTVEAPLYISYNDHVRLDNVPIHHLLEFYQICNIPLADIWFLDPPFNMLDKRNERGARDPSLGLEESDILSEEDMIATVNLMDKHSKPNAMILLSHKFADFFRWSELIENVNWKVYDLPLIARPTRSYNPKKNVGKVKEAHSFWLVAYRGKPFENPTAEKEGAWPKNLAYTNAVSFTPTDKWYGPSTSKGHFRPSQKSEDLLRNILLRYISQQNNTFSNNICIFDPFMGTGTAGVIALQFYCKFFGNDKDLKAFTVAKERIVKHI